ncbi:MAG: apolipoprotein N-acyltransferase [Verrucomicrobiota bacterium]|jgi:apolipoprotein N-acyltransferase
MRSTWLTRVLRVWPWVAAIASGLLYAASFAPFNQDWLCWICLTPLISAIWFSGKDSRRKWLRDLLLGYVAGVVFFTITFSWLGSLGTLFESVWLKGLSLLLSLYLGMNLAFWAWVIGLITPGDFLRSWRNLLAAFVAASAWVTHEWIRGWLFGGFGWNGLGVAQHANWLLIQVAEFSGVAGLSFVIVFANIIAVAVPPRLFQEARLHRMRPHWDLNLTVLGVLGLLVFGWNATHQPRLTKRVRIAAVQPGISQKEKFDRTSNVRISEQIARLSQAALTMNPKPQLLIWPESATPGPIFEDEYSHRFVTDFAASAQTDLLLGSDVFENDQAYNAAVYFPATGNQPEIYRKIHLVPFGEYVPLRHSFPPFDAVAGQWVPGDFAFGRDFTLFRLTTADVKVAPLICFEDTIGELTRRFVLPRDSSPGADLLVNITNDGWFLHSAGSQLHLANAIFRCIETRRPMVRAANTGVTCFVNEFGRITQILQDETGSTFTEGVLVGDVEVPTDAVLTFFVRHGELFSQMCVMFTMIAIGIHLARRRLAT